MSNQPTAEQRARDLLERLGVPGAQQYTAGDLVELANLIADADRAARTCGNCGNGQPDHSGMVYCTLYGSRWPTDDGCRLGWPPRAVTA